MSQPTTFEDAVASQRPRLIRLCAALTGDWDDAEDLAQETLVEAWRHRERVTHTEGYGAWLAAIARNVCLRWSRIQGREYERAVRFANELTPRSCHDTIFERTELAEVLAHALASLPVSTRMALLACYADDLPLSEVASTLQMTENAVAVRLHRGKLALRQLLASELSGDAGLPMWQPTTIWCPYCGNQRLVMQAQSAGDESFWLRCPHCCSPVGAYFMRLQYQPQRNPIHVIDEFGRNLRQDLNDGMKCPFCGMAGRLNTTLSNGHVLQAGAWIVGRTCMCVPARCEMWLYHNEIALYTVEGLHFWRTHKRIRALPDQLIDINGVAAFLTRFESAVGRARLEVVTLRETCQVIQIEEAAA